MSDWGGYLEHLPILPALQFLMDYCQKLWFVGGVWRVTCGVIMALFYEVTFKTKTLSCSQNFPCRGIILLGLAWGYCKIVSFSLSFSFINPRFWVLICFNHRNRITQKLVFDLVAQEYGLTKAQVYTNFPSTLALVMFISTFNRW